MRLFLFGVFALNCSTTDYRAGFAQIQKEENSIWLSANRDTAYRSEDYFEILLRLERNALVPLKVNKKMLITTVYSKLEEGIYLLIRRNDSLYYHLNLDGKESLPSYVWFNKWNSIDLKYRLRFRDLVPAGSDIYLKGVDYTRNYRNTDEGAYEIQARLTGYSNEPIFSNVILVHYVKEP